MNKLTNRDRLSYRLAVQCQENDINYKLRQRLTTVTSVTVTDCPTPNHSTVYSTVNGQTDSMIAGKPVSPVCRHRV